MFLRKVFTQFFIAKCFKKSCLFNLNESEYIMYLLYSFLDFFALTNGGVNSYFL